MCRMVNNDDVAAPGTNIFWKTVQKTCKKIKTVLWKKKCPLDNINARGVLWTCLLIYVSNCDGRICIQQNKGFTRKCLSTCLDVSVHIAGYFPFVFWIKCSSISLIIEKSVMKLRECCMGVRDITAPGAKTFMTSVITKVCSITMMS